MLGSDIVADSPENKPPDYPVISIRWVIHDGFLYLFDSFSHLSLFKKRESPMAVAVMRAIWVVKFCLVTHIYGLRVILMHVVDKGQVIVGERMLRVQMGADFQVLYST